METSKYDNQLFSSAWILELCKSNKRLLLLISVVSIALFSVIACVFPSEYRATVVLFPASNESASHALLNDNSSSKGVSRFGETEEVEYFLQVLYSDQIKEYITKHFDLYSHYGIDTSSSFPKTKLANKWENNVSFRKTEFLSIEIEVFDKDPKTAAEMANAIADYSDTLYNKIKNERALKAFNIVKKEYFEALANIQQMQDSLQKLRELGVMNYEAQSEVYSDAYAQALAKGNKEGAKAIEEKFKVLAQYGGTYQMFDEILTYESKRITELKQKYLEAKVDAEQYIPYKFVVSRAETPEKEYYPIRWLIVLTGLTSTLLLTFFIMAFLSQKKKLSTSMNKTNIWKEIKNYINTYELFNYDGMEKLFNNKSLFQLIAKWKWHLTVIGIISIALGAFISSPIVITPKFKSSAIVYPTNLPEYSKESTTEQMFQILMSTDIKFKMLDAFNLDKHYKLDKKDPQFVTYFLDEYNQNVNISKTEYESIEINVFDKDRNVAKEMVDSIIAFYNFKVAELHKRKQQEMIEIMGNAMKEKRAEIDSVEKQLIDMRTKYGILNYTQQSVEATKGMLTGNKQATELYKNLEQYGGLYKEMDSLSWHFRKELINYKWQYENAIREYRKNITYAQVVQKPFPADKKSYPVRWAIVALTLLGGLIVALIGIAFVESKNQKKTSDVEA